MLVADSRPPRVGQIAADTDARCVAGQNNNRTSLAVVNLGPATIYLGFDPGVSVNSGFGLPANVGIELDYPGPVYVVAAASGSVASYLEESRP